MPTRLSKTRKQYVPTELIHSINRLSLYYRRAAICHAIVYGNMNASNWEEEGLIHQQLETM